MEAVSYSLHQTVFGILKTLVIHTSQNNLDLTYNVNPDIPDQLIGDSLRLRQVITNLVGNAIKFTPSNISSKGHVALSTRLLVLDDSSVTFEFCVLDTGISIAKDKLNLIFNTFCQADGSTTRVISHLYHPYEQSLMPSTFTGIQRHWIGIINFETSRISDARQHVGRERGIKREQVLLHYHLPNQPKQP